MGYYNCASTQNILKYNLFHICNSPVLRILLVSVQNHDSSTTIKRNTWVPLSKDNSPLLKQVNGSSSEHCHPAQQSWLYGCDKDGGSEPLTPLVPGFQVRELKRLQCEHVFHMGQSEKSI